MFKDPVQRVCLALRGSAHGLFVWVILVLAAFVIGAAGAGFLVASVFWGLSAVMGPALAAFLTGLFLLLVAAACLVVASRRLSHPVPAEAPKSDAPASPAQAADPLAQVAFVAAFVLGRYLSGDPRR